MCSGGSFARDSAQIAATAAVTTHFKGFSVNFAAYRSFVAIYLRCSINNIDPGGLTALALNMLSRVYEKYY